MNINIDMALAEIENHFKNLTVEEFENNLIDSGIGTIKSTISSGMELVFEEESNIYPQVNQMNSVKDCNKFDPLTVLVA